METKFQSTFIPKGPMAPASSAAMVTKVKRRSFFGFIALLILLLSLVLSVGVYGYEKFLISRIGKMGADLEEARKTLAADAITQVVRLNSRIEATGEVLNKHTVISTLFDFLEQNTVSVVRFRDVGYKVEQGKILLDLRGEARGYNALALQSDILSKSKYIKNPVFSDLSLDQKGNVNFNFTAELDPSIIAYKNIVEKIPVAGPTLPATVSSSSTATSTKTSTSTPR